MTFKKILATSLSFIMVAGGLSLAFASSNNEYVPVFAEEHAHNLVTFDEWTSTDSLPANGAYYLANDVTISSTWKPANDTKLCLNGHGIRMTGSGSVIESPANGYLQILDCDKSTEHRYTFDETGLAVVDDSLTGDYETFIGGYITGGNATSGGGILVRTPGKSQTSWLYMLDVTVIGNHASGNGGGIGYNYGSKARSIILLTDCSIIGNVADGIGGGVFHQANQRFMDFSGNTVITKNISGSGCAGVYEQSGLYISHNVFLYGNTLKDGTPSDLYIGHGSGGQPDKLILEADLEASSRIGIQYLRLETIYDYYNHCSEDPNNIFISNVNNRFFTKNGDTNNVIYNKLTKTDCSCDYDGGEHTGELSLADDSIDYEIKYGTKEGEYTLTEIPSFTEAGDHKIYYQATAGNNISKDVINVKISKIPAVLDTTPTVKSNTNYTGESYQLVDSGTATGGTLMYKINDGEYSDTLPSATNVGNYDITYYVKGDSNHSDLAETSLTSVSILANDKTELVSTLASTNDYYNSIKDDYPLFASNLKLALDNGNAINSNDNVTVEQIVEAINTLQSAKQAATNNVTKVVDVETKIDAIGEVTLEKEDAINSARKDYDALTEEQKKEVNDDKLATLVDAENTLLVKKHASSVKEAIDAIGVVTLDKENDIIAVRNSYNALSGAEKAEVGEVYLSKLVNAENTLKALKDKKAADEVKTLIDNIGEVVLSDECNKKIETARAAYDSLTPEQKSLISEANEILAEKETTYTQLLERSKKATPMLIVSISVAVGVILVLVLLYFLPFIINKRYIIDTNNNKIKRVAYIKESDGTVLLITHSFRRIRCNESEVYNSKAEAEEALNKVTHSHL